MTLDLINDRKVGIKAISIVRRESQRKEIEARGALCIVSETEDVKKRISELTNGQGVKIAFDALGGGPVASAVVDSLQLNGTLHFYGALEFGNPWSYSIADALFKQRAVKVITQHLVNFFSC
jgi:threonine dehydrogenase-like Zn-dependent dehydrogenase